MDRLHKVYRVIQIKDALSYCHGVVAVGFQLGYVASIDPFLFISESNGNIPALMQP